MQTQSCRAFRGQELNTHFFSNFSDNSGISRQKFGFPWVSNDILNSLGPHPFVEDPHPTRRYLDQKVWVWVPVFFGFQLLNNFPKDASFLLTVEFFCLRFVFFIFGWGTANKNDQTQFPDRGEQQRKQKQTNFHRNQTKQTEFQL